MRIIKFIIFITMFFVLTQINAKSQSDSTITGEKQSNFLMNINLGISSNTDSLSQPIDKTNLCATLRLLWQPGYNLNLGMETGWIHVSHLKKTQIETPFGITEARAILAFTPILFIINKKILGFDFYAGIGASHFWSTVEAFGETSSSEDWDYCYMFSLAYYWNISKSFGIGIESKYLTVSQLEKTVGSLHISLNYNLLTW